jgi:hypothetical protein
LKEITIWDRLKFWAFIKLGTSMWMYRILHIDYWKRPYGVSFTNERDWLKKVNEDMKDATDLEKISEE